MASLPPLSIRMIPLLLTLLLAPFAALAVAQGTPPQLLLSPSAPRAGGAVTVIVERALFGGARRGVVELIPLSGDAAPLRAEVEALRGTVRFELPADPGAYELRFAPLGSAVATVLAFDAISPVGVLRAPVSVEAEAPIEVAWDDPGRPGDRLELVARGVPVIAVDPAGATRTVLLAPVEAGDYELIYRSAGGAELARSPLEVRPADVAEVLGAECTSPATAAELERAFDDGLDTLLRAAERLYGRRYSDLDYSYRLRPPDALETRTSVSVNYDGSATDILTGERVSARGTLRAEFRWFGCRWVLDDVVF